jgi:flagellar export protein FliJ
LSSQDLKFQIQRLDRLFHIRETFVSVAEARVKEAEQEVARLEEAAAEIARKIQLAMEELAYPNQVTGLAIQYAQNHLKLLRLRAEEADRSLSAARAFLDARRHEWTEAMREQKVVETLQERRLHERDRQDATAEQKLLDEVSIGRFVREIRNLKPET